MILRSGLCQCLPCQICKELASVEFCKRRREGGREAEREREREREREKENKYTICLLVSSASH